MPDKPPHIYRGPKMNGKHSINSSIGWQHKTWPRHCVLSQ